MVKMPPRTLPGGQPGPRRPARHPAPRPRPRRRNACNYIASRAAVLNESNPPVQRGGRQLKEAEQGSWTPRRPLKRFGQFPRRRGHRPRAGARSSARRKRAAAWPAAARRRRGAGCFVCTVSPGCLRGGHKCCRERQSGTQLADANQNGHTHTHTLGMQGAADAAAAARGRAGPAAAAGGVMRARDADLRCSGPRLARNCGALGARSAAERARQKRGLGSCWPTARVRAVAAPATAVYAAAVPFGGI